ncbi:MAG: hypothetical protein JW937_09975, partial [Candidatus Omnitrophica bacterium]|nr:hypothetical protein [Candidatus Omnitrophota bacterium]
MLQAAPSAGGRFFASKTRPATASSQTSAQQIVEAIASGPAEALSLEDISAFTVPETAGRVVDTFSPQGTAPKRTLIHIQDLHTHSEAQANISALLQDLNQHYGVDLVFMEGAAGDVDTSAVSGFPIKEIRQQVASLFLSEGELTGAEYFSIVEAPEARLFGVETPTLYLDHLLAHELALHYNREAGPALDQIETHLASLKPLVFSEPLMELDEKAHLFTDQSLGLGEYIQYLGETASNLGLDLDAEETRHVGALYRTQKFEEMIDTEATNREVQDLVQKLSKALSEAGKRQALQELLDLTVGLREGHTKPLAFYRRLLELRTTHLSAEDEARALQATVAYLEANSRIDASQLPGQMETVYDQILVQLARTPQERELGVNLQHVRLLREAFSLKLNSRKWKQYQEDPSAFQTRAFRSFSQSLGLDDPGIARVDWRNAAEKIDPHLPNVERFYDLAHERDRVMVTHALDKMNELGAGNAVIITGGYHTEGMMRYLRMQDVAYAVVAPRATTPHDEERYHRILTGQTLDFAALLAKLSRTSLAAIAGFDSEIARTAALEWIKQPGVLAELAELDAKNRDAFDAIASQQEISLEAQTTLLMLEHAANNNFSAEAGAFAKALFANGKNTELQTQITRLLTGNGIHLAHATEIQTLVHSPILAPVQAIEQLAGQLAGRLRQLQEAPTTELSDPEIQVLFNAINTLAAAATSNHDEVQSKALNGLGQALKELGTLGAKVYQQAGWESHVHALALHTYRKYVEIDRDVTLPTKNIRYLQIELQSSQQAQADLTEITVRLRNSDGSSPGTGLNGTAALYQALTQARGIFPGEDSPAGTVLAALPALSSAAVTPAPATPALPGDQMKGTLSIHALAGNWQSTLVLQPDQNEYGEAGIAALLSKISQEDARAVTERRSSVEAAYNDLLAGLADSSSYTGIEFWWADLGPEAGPALVTNTLPDRAQDGTIFLVLNTQWTAYPDLMIEGLFHDLRQASWQYLLGIPAGNAHRMAAMETTLEFGIASAYWYWQTQAAADDLEDPAQAAGALNRLEGWVTEDRSLYRDLFSQYSAQIPERLRNQVSRMGGPLVAQEAYENTLSDSFNTVLIHAKAETLSERIPAIRQDLDRVASGNLESTILRSLAAVRALTPLRGSADFDIRTYSPLQQELYSLFQEAVQLEQTGLFLDQNPAWQANMKQYLALLRLEIQQTLARLENAPENFPWGGTFGEQQTADLAFLRGNRQVIESRLAQNHTYS